jgi:NAD(P)-dependent dehydrogenase (short-subunit alcohol dehydrogenase family)
MLESEVTAMAGQFEGKVALITGASGNLGQAVTRRFARDGAKLVLVDRNAEKLKALADTMQSDYQAESFVTSADLSDPAAVAKLFNDAAGAFGQVDVVTHTVGGYDAGKNVADLDLDVWDKMMNLNARPVYLIGGQAAKHMLEKGVAGKIVFVLARASLKGAAGSSAYTASKAAAQRVMESLSAEVRDAGIHVNAVLPSTIDTPPNRESMPKADTSKWVTPEQVADAIAFLASDAASALHGVSLEVYNRA